MKRIASVTTIVVLFGALAGSAAWAQNAPLGDYARQARKQKNKQAPSAKSYDNDNLPRNDKLSVVGEAPAETADASTASSSGGEAAAEAKAAVAGANPTAPAPVKQEPAAQSASAEEKKSAEDEKQKMLKDWQTKMQKAQAQVDELAKDLDLTNREYRLRAASFYADAGNRLRNAGQWDKEDTQFKEQIADKQKKLDEAKQQLEDLREQARKAGVPSSMRE